MGGGREERKRGNYRLQPLESMKSLPAFSACLFPTQTPSFFIFLEDPRPSVYEWGEYKLTY